MSAIRNRPFAWGTDTERITQFLLMTYTHCGRLFNWDPRRWLGTVYHNNDASMEERRRELPKSVHIWEDPIGQIVGVVIPESVGSVFLQIHPDHRQLEEEMIDWAEAHLPRGSDDGRAHLDLWAEELDVYRAGLLEARGYTRTEMYETMYRRPMSEPVPDHPAPEGYQVRTMQRTADDQQKLAALLNAAFGRTFHSAEEYRNFQRMPYYRDDLDIVVEAPDGVLAANAGFTAHERESFALVEPVCTHPHHQGKGLARAAIAEGLRRVQAQGLEACFIGAWHSNATANHVYQSMGFRDGVRLYLWRRWE